MAPEDERDLIEAVVTCEGNLHDPDFSTRFQGIVGKLKTILYTTSKEQPFRVRKIEPWNSVRVTISIPKEAAHRLRVLAQQGSTVLRQLGILSVQVEGDQVISLTLAGRYNEAQEIILKQNSESAGSGLPGSSSSSCLPSSSSNCAPSVLSSVPTAGPSGVTVPLDVLSSPSSAFRSPNVIAPGGESIPTPPRNIGAGLKSTLGGPFPFASMTHAANTIQRSETSNVTSVVTNSTNSSSTSPTFSTSLTIPLPTTSSSLNGGPVLKGASARVSLNSCNPAAVTAASISAPVRKINSSVVSTGNFVSKTSVLVTEAVNAKSCSTSQNSVHNSSNSPFIPPSTPPNVVVVVNKTAQLQGDAKFNPSQQAQHLQHHSKFQAVLKAPSTPTGLLREKDKLAPHLTGVLNSQLASVGKPRQFLINPLTGHLEPRPNESSSDSEGDGDDHHRPSKARGSFLKSNRSKDNLINACGWERSVIPPSSPKPVKLTIDPSKINRFLGTSGPALVARKSKDDADVLPKDLNPASINCSIADKRKKLKVKIEKVSTSGASVSMGQSSSSNSSTPSLATTSGSTLPGDVPRVPPLHISLRGKNAAVVVSPRRDESKDPSSEKVLTTSYPRTSNAAIVKRTKMRRKSNESTIGTSSVESVETLLSKKALKPLSTPAVLSSGVDELGDPLRSRLSLDVNSSPLQAVADVKNAVHKNSVSDLISGKPPSPGVSSNAIPSLSSTAAAKVNKKHRHKSDSRPGFISTHLTEKEISKNANAVLEASQLMKLLSQEARKEGSSSPKTSDRLLTHSLSNSVEASSCDKEKEREISFKTTCAEEVSMTGTTGVNSAVVGDLVSLQRVEKLIDVFKDAALPSTIPLREGDVLPKLDSGISAGTSFATALNDDYLSLKGGNVDEDEGATVPNRPALVGSVCKPAPLASSTSLMPDSQFVVGKVSQLSSAIDGHVSDDHKDLFKTSYSTSSSSGSASLSLSSFKPGAPKDPSLTQSLGSSILNQMLSVKSSEADPVIPLDSKRLSDLASSFPMDKFTMPSVLKVTVQSLPLVSAEPDSERSTHNRGTKCQIGVDSGDADSVVSVPPDSAEQERNSVSTLCEAVVEGAMEVEMQPHPTESKVREIVMEVHSTEKTLPLSGSAGSPAAVPDMAAPSSSTSGVTGESNNSRLSGLTLPSNPSVAPSGAKPDDQNGGTGEDSGIDSMDALSEKSPNQGESPARKNENEHSFCDNPTSSAHQPSKVSTVLTESSTGDTDISVLPESNEPSNAVEAPGIAAEHEVIASERNETSSGDLDATECKLSSETDNKSCDTSCKLNQTIIPEVPLPDNEISAGDSAFVSTEGLLSESCEGASLEQLDVSSEGDVLSVANVRAAMELSVDVLTKAEPKIFTSNSASGTQASMLLQASGEDIQALSSLAAGTLKPEKESSFVQFSSDLKDNGVKLIPQNVDGAKLLTEGSTDVLQTVNQCFHEAEPAKDDPAMEKPLSVESSQAYAVEHIDSRLAQNTAVLESDSQAKSETLFPCNNTSEIFVKANQQELTVKILDSQSHNSGNSTQSPPQVVNAFESAQSVSDSSSERTLLERSNDVVLDPTSDQGNKDSNGTLSSDNAREGPFSVSVNLQEKSEQPCVIPEGSVIKKETKSLNNKSGFSTDFKNESPTTNSQSELVKVKDWDFKEKTENQTVSSILPTKRETPINVICSGTSNEATVKFPEKLSVAEPLKQVEKGKRGLEFIVQKISGSSPTAGSKFSKQVVSGVIESSLKMSAVSELESLNEITKRTPEAVKICTSAEALRDQASTGLKIDQVVPPVSKALQKIPAMVKDQVKIEKAEIGLNRIRSTVETIAKSGNENVEEGSHVLSKTTSDPIQAVKLPAQTMVSESIGLQSKSTQIRAALENTSAGVTSNATVAVTNSQLHPILIRPGHSQPLSFSVDSSVSSAVQNRHPMEITLGQKAEAKPSVSISVSKGVPNVIQIAKTTGAAFAGKMPISGTTGSQGQPIARTSPLLVSLATTTPSTSIVTASGAPAMLAQWLPGHKMVPIKLVTLPKQNQPQLQSIVGARSSPVLETVNFVNTSSRSISPSSANKVGPNHSVQSPPIGVASVTSGSLPLSTYMVPISVASASPAGSNPVKVLVSSPVKMQQNLLQSVVVKGQLVMANQGQSHPTIRVVRPFFQPDPAPPEQEVQATIEEKPAKTDEDIVQNASPKSSSDENHDKTSLYDGVDGVEILETEEGNEDELYAFEADIIHDEKDLEDVLANETSGENGLSSKTSENGPYDFPKSEDERSSSPDSLSLTTQRFSSLKSDREKFQTKSIEKEQPVLSSLDTEIDKIDSPIPAMRASSPLYTYSNRGGRNSHSASDCSSPSPAEPDVHGEDQEIIDCLSRSPSQPKLSPQNKPLPTLENDSDYGSPVKPELHPDHTYVIGNTRGGATPAPQLEQLSIEIPNSDISSVSPSTTDDGKKCIRNTRSNTRLVSPDITAFRSDTPKPIKFTNKPDGSSLRNSPKPSPTGSSKSHSPGMSAASSSSRGSPVLPQGNMSGYLVNVGRNSPTTLTVASRTVVVSSLVSKRKRQESDSSSASRDDITEDVKIDVDLNARPGKRKCSENAAELIKACIGVEDTPKRNTSLIKKMEMQESKPKDLAAKGKKSMMSVLIEENEEDSDTSESLSRSRAGGLSSRGSSEDRSSSRSSSVQRCINPAKLNHKEEESKDSKIIRANNRAAGNKDLSAKSKPSEKEITNSGVIKKDEKAQSPVGRRSNRNAPVKEKSPLAIAKPRSNIKRDAQGTPVGAQKITASPENGNPRRKTRSSAAGMSESGVTTYKRRRISKDAKS